MESFLQSRQEAERSLPSGASNSAINSSSKSPSTIAQMSDQSIYQTMEWTRSSVSHCTDPRCDDNNCSTNELSHNDPALETITQNVDVDVEPENGHSIQSQRPSTAQQGGTNLQRFLESKRRVPEPRRVPAPRGRPSLAELLRRDEGAVDFIRQSGLSIHIVPGDGACFFHAVSLDLEYDNHRGNHSHLHLRERTVQWMRDHPDLWSNFLVDETVQGRLKRMSNPKESAEEIELMALSSILRRQIRVHSWDWQNAISHLPYRDVVPLGEDGIVNERPIVVFHRMENHYDLLRAEFMEERIAASEASYEQGHDATNDENILQSLNGRDADTDDGPDFDTVDEDIVTELSEDDDNIKVMYSDFNKRQPLQNDEDDSNDDLPILSPCYYDSDDSDYLPSLNDRDCDTSDDDDSQACFDDDVIERLLAQGGDARNQDQYEDAVEFFSQALFIDPANPSALLNRSYAFSKLQDWNQSVDDANSFINADHDNSIQNGMAFHLRGKGRMQLSLHGEGDFREALDDFHTALTFDTTESMAVNILNMIDECKSTRPQPSSSDSEVAGDPVDSQSSDNDNEVVEDAVDSQSSDNVDSVLIFRGRSSTRMSNVRSRSLSSNRTNRATTRSMSNRRGYRSLSRRRPLSAPNSDHSTYSIPFCETKCGNCKREQFVDDENSDYFLKFHQVSSSAVPKFGHEYQFLRKFTGVHTECQYNLCDECYHFLVKKDRYDFTHMWPGFYWHLLSSTFNQTFPASKRYYFHVYSGEHIWQMIPVQMRRWWINSIQGFNIHNEFPYADCTIEHPPSFFEDRTLSFQKFEDDFDAGGVPRLMKAMNNKQVLLPLVLCPFGCTEFCHRSKYLDLDVVIQRYLQKVVLPLKSKTPYGNVMSMSPFYFRDNLSYDALMYNEAWMIKPTIILTNIGAKVLTCRNHNGGDKYLRLHPPLTPHHIIPAHRADQLSHIKTKPRIVKPTSRSHFVTSFAMVGTYGCFSGIDNLNVSRNADWSRPSHLLSQHESISLSGRNDIKHLLSRKVETGQVTKELADSMLKSSREIPHGSLDKYRQGATFMPYADMVDVHLAQTHEDYDRDLICIKTLELGQETIIHARRSWQRLINTLHTEDRHGFGTQFRAIPILATKNKASMMTWTLCSIISSVKDLWKVLDTPKGPWRYDGWPGWMMTFIQSQVFPFDSVRRDNRSPFKKIRSFKQIVGKVNKFAPVICHEDDDIYSTQETYKMSADFMRKFFCPVTYPSISVYESVLDIPAQSRMLRRNTIIITSSGLPLAFGRHPFVDDPLYDKIQLQDGTLFELRSIALLRVPDEGNCNDGSKYEAVRFMRHGGPAYSKFWQQQRSQSITSQCDFDPLQMVLDWSREEDADDSYRFQYHSMVYVKVEAFNVDKFRLDILRTMGGKTHVQCTCNNFPLLIQPHQKDKEIRKKCVKCNRFEYVACCNEECRLRLCKTCFDEYPTHFTTFLNPNGNTQQRHETNDASNGDCDSIHNNEDPSLSDDYDPLQEEIERLAREEEIERMTREEENASDDEEDDLIEPHEPQDEENEESEDHVADEAELYGLSGLPDDDDNDSETDNFINDNVNRITEEGEALMTYADIDASHEQSADNIDLSSGYMTTQAGDLPTDIEDRHGMDRVSGHTLYNQAAVCLDRRQHRITGTKAQQNFVQSFCNTTPGQPNHLLSIEQALFPRILWSSATSDGLSVLGAIPSSLFGPKEHIHGFASLPDTIRSRISTSGSLMSTDKNYHFYSHDVLANKALAHGDSRQVISRGFQVDASKPIGLSVRNSNTTGLTECVDSHKMVRGLAASQEYHEYHKFTTITANHSQSPGLKPIHEWKVKEGWSDMFPNWKTMNCFDKIEIKMGIEEQSGPILLRVWLEIRALFLAHMKQENNFIGPMHEVIFGRDEYQSGMGNLPHLHIVDALRRAGLPPEGAQYFEDLIRTTGAEVIRVDEIESLIERGMIKDFSEYEDIIEFTKFLKHTCKPRCQMRIKPGDGPECFKCKKIHAVRDHPDPTQHAYIQIPVKLKQETLDMLVRIGMAERVDDDNVEYSHPFFKPTRHMAPCVSNAEDNMSPVTTDLFILFKSMCNVQFICCSNGIVKYILKYVAKFDECNRVTASSNIHTGAVEVGSTFLHNTKIATSKINEDKSLDNRRDKKRPQGRSTAWMEIYQLLSNISEVTTNLTFEEYSTLPFEVRMRSAIKLKDDGRVREFDENNAGSDHHMSGIPSHLAREEHADDLHDRQMMTLSQKETAQDHQKVSRSFDKVSIFGLRPPELVSVFENPKYYYRYCKIEKTVMGKEGITKVLNSDLKRCLWIDSIGRLVRLRKNGLDEVLALLDSNEEDEDRHRDVDDNFPINDTIRYIIRIHNTEDDTLSEEERDWKEEYLHEFIVDDGLELLPIPVATPVTPHNPHAFFVHIVLSLGKYVTEQDVLRHSTPRECFQRAGLIGESTDPLDLQEYVDSLLFNYINNQVVYYPNSLRATGTFIELADRLFSDIIMRNEFTASEIPFLVTDMLDQANDEQMQWWKDIKESQLKSIYASVCRGGMNSHLPQIEEMMASTKACPVVYNAVESFHQFPNQNEASYTEQKLAIQTNITSINKYCGRHGRNGALTCTRNCITHGSPGSGKSYVVQISVFYSISQGLNTLSSCIQGARANAIGGIHLHKWILLHDQKHTRFSYRAAQQAIEKILRKPINLHVLLTLDVLFLDECGQISAEQVATLDIIFRKVRNSNLPFGGVLIIGTLDHAQCQPINALPFLMSSLMLTSFTFVQLRESVRADEDEIHFREFQQLTRLPPNKLKADSVLKSRFYDLAGNIFTFATDWADPKITRHTTRMYARKTYVKSATRLFTDSLINDVQSDPMQEGQYRIRPSLDSQVRVGSRSEYSNADSHSVKALNDALREPDLLCLVQWGVYECTINDPGGNFNQSTICVLVDVPDASVINSFGTFPVFIAPPGSQIVEFLYDGSDRPSKEQLKEWGWKEAKISVAPERPVTARRGFQAKRTQYALKHTGALTVNKSQGDTIPGTLAVEISHQTSPWEKEQVVVIFSRTKRAKDIIIVGPDKSWILDKLWDLVIKGNQWNQMMENILDVLTINPALDNNDGTDTRVRSVIDYPRNHPFGSRYASLPSDDTGFVYLLCSENNLDFTYIGQTQNIRQRFREHQSGNGAFGTSRRKDQPFFLAGYISGLTGYDDADRCQVERRWRNLRNRLPINSVANIMDCGERIADEINAVAHDGGSEVRATFHRLASREFLEWRHNQRISE